MKINGVTIAHVIFVAMMVILALVMSEASCQFRDHINKESEDSKNKDSIAQLQPLKIMSISIEDEGKVSADGINKQKNIRMLSVSELKRLMDSINSGILDNQAQIIKRQDDLISDVRQETNNNLDKHSAWLAFWITILGFIGVVSPIAYQMMQSKTLEHKLDDTRRNFEKIQEAYTLKMEMLSFETIILNSNLEYTSEWRRLYIDSVKRHFKEFVSLVDCEEKKWDDEKIHICNVLVNLESFLRRLLRDAQYDEYRRIQDVIDLIQNLLKPLSTSHKYSLVKYRLIKIGTTLAKI